jgi:hypothetical protein
MGHICDVVTCQIEEKERPTHKEKNLGRPKERESERHI